MLARISSRTTSSTGLHCASLTIGPFGGSALEPSGFGFWRLGWASFFLGAVSLTTSRNGLLKGSRSTSSSSSSSSILGREFSALLGVVAWKRYPDTGVTSSEDSVRSVIGVMKGRRLLAISNGSLYGRVGGS